MFAWNNGRGRVGDLPELRAVTGAVRQRRSVRHPRHHALERHDIGSAGGDEPCPGQRAMVSHGYWLRELGGRDLTALIGCASTAT